MKASLEDRVSAFKLDAETAISALEALRAHATKTEGKLAAAIVVSVPSTRLRSGTRTRASLGCSGAACPR
jgi:hypothetical protein